MDYQFINSNNGTVDGATRRRIRSHAARGRNAGRTITRPSRRELAARSAGNRNTPVAVINRVPDIVLAAHLVPAAAQNEEDGDMAAAAADGNATDVTQSAGLAIAALSVIERSIYDGLCFPIELRTQKAKRLTRWVFSFFSKSRQPFGLSNAVRTPESSRHSICLRFMLTDEACFHSVIALSITALDSIVAEQKDTVKAMDHLSCSFRLINSRLESARECATDESIVSVVCLAQYERHRGQFRQGYVHILGMQRMAELRGGIAALARAKPELAQKIFINDLEYALHLGFATLHTHKDVEPVGCPLSSLELCGGCSPALSRLVIRPELLSLFADSTGLATLLNLADDGQAPKVDNYRFHDTIILLGFRLIGIRPFAPPAGYEGGEEFNWAEKAVHTGLAAFMMTFFRRMDKRIAENQLLSSLVREVAREHVGQSSKDAEEQQELLMWVLYIGWAAEMLGDADEEQWLLPKAAEMARLLGLHDWEDLKRMLYRFPWVGPVHSKAGSELWRRVSSFLSV